MNDDRLTEIEIKLALSEDLLDALNRQVYAQQQQIDLLQAQLRHLYAQISAQSGPAEQRSLRDEIPPHY